MRKTFILIVMLLFASPALGATYYMRADGTAASGNPPTAPGPCETVGNTLSIANHDASTFSAGDTIYLCDDGGIYRDQMDIPSSGSSGNPITYDAASGDTPVISAADVTTTSWTNHDTNVWKMTYASGSNVILIIDGTLYTEVGSVGALTADTYYIDDAADTLYAYSTSDPDSRSTEVSARQYGIWGATKQYTTVKNITVYGGSYAGVRYYGNQANGYNIVDGVTSYYNRIMGIVFDGGQFHNTAQNCTVYGSGNGIYANSTADYSTFSNNTVYNSITHAIGQVTDGDGVAAYDSNYITIEGNTSYNNMRSGIALDPNGKVGYIIRYNTAYGNGATLEGYGLQMGNGGGTVADHMIYYNVFYLNHGNQGCGNLGSGGPASFYNNVFYCPETSGDQRNVMLNVGSYVFKNNIVTCGSGSGNDACMVLGSTATVTADYNIVDAGHATGYALIDEPWAWHTWAEWQGHGYDANGSNSDPAFTNAASYDFTLTSSSPAIDEGVDVGLTTDYNGKLFVGTVDIGAWEYLYKPVLINPSSSESDVGVMLPLRLEWQDVDNAILYQIQIDDSVGFTSPEVDETTANTYYETSALAPGTHFYWRVRAVRRWN